MSELLRQLPALIGVVVGAACSYLIHAVSDRAHWRRQKDERWDNSRMLAYSAYGHSVTTCWMWAIRMVDQRYDKVLEPIPFDEGLANLAAAQLARAERWQQVLLLGDPATIEAARRWHESVFVLDGFAREIVRGYDGYVQARAEAERARAAFYATARRDLGVVGSPPASTWPQGALQQALEGTRQVADVVGEGPSG